MHGQNIDLFPQFQTDMKHSVSLTAYELLEDILNSGAAIHTRVTGFSMAPFIRSGEVVTLRKVTPSVLRKGELILFRNSEGRLILHRIVKIGSGKGDEVILQTKGDAAGFDEPIPSWRVLGKVSRIEKSVPFWGVSDINMDAAFWKKTGYLIAMISAMNPVIRYPIFIFYKKMKVLFHFIADKGRLQAFINT
jgi:signal peptidase